MTVPKEKGALLGVVTTVLTTVATILLGIVLGMIVDIRNNQETIMVRMATFDQMAIDGFPRLKAVEGQSVDAQVRISVLEAQVKAVQDQAVSNRPDHMSSNQP